MEEMTATRYVRSYWGSFLAGALIAMITASWIDTIGDWIWDRYDALFPVWTDVKANVVSYKDDVAVIRISGKKVRKCSLHRLWAVAVYPDSVMSDIALERGDGAPIGRTYPLGFHSLGPYYLSPVRPTVTRLMLQIEHECSGRHVDSTFADIDMQNVIREMAEESPPKRAGQ